MPGIPPRNRSALKEWASVETALQRGATILMLRKGGIYEQKHGFRLEHRQFWIFPTLFHQSANDIAPAYDWVLDTVADRGTVMGSLQIASYVEVTDAIRVERLDALERLSGLHPLAEPTVHARFHYKRRPYLHVLIARLHRAAEPHRIAELPEYEGCVSWVELQDPLSTATLSPVLTEADFADRRCKVLTLLGGDGVAAI